MGTRPISGFSWIISDQIGCLMEFATIGATGWPP